MSDEAKLAALRQAHAEDVRVLIYNNERMEEEIERLEAELASLKANYVTAVGTVRQLEAELADLRASSVVYKVRCETCGGFGEVKCDHPFGCPGDHPCPEPRCDNGWQLAEGVHAIDAGFFMDDTTPGYFIPAEMVEGTG